MGLSYFLCFPADVQRKRAVKKAASARWLLELVLCLPYPLPAELQTV